MTIPPLGPIDAAHGGTDPREAAMRKAAADLQGLFVQQLYKAMRASVPTEGALVEQSQGEEMFTSLMDERVASDTGLRWHRGLGEAIYRAMQQKAGEDAATAAAPGMPTAQVSVEAPVVPVAPPARTP